MEMIASRNKSSHTYNESVVKEIREKIFGTYYTLFIDLKNKMINL